MASGLPFIDLAVLKADKIDPFIKSAKEIGASIAVQRLLFVYQNYDRLTPDAAHTSLDAEAIRDEVEETLTRRSHVYLFQGIRNSLSLLPLIMTWFALFQAITDYQRDIKLHPQDIYQPLLELWQTGFHGAATTLPFTTAVLTFTTVALIDVFFLLLYVSFMIFVMWLESKVRKDANSFVSDYQLIADELLQVISNYGVLPVASTREVDQVTAAIKQVLNKAVAETSQLVNVAKTSIQELSLQNQKMLENTTVAMQKMLNRAAQENTQTIKDAFLQAQVPLQQIVTTSQNAIESADKRGEELFTNRIVPLVTTFNDAITTLQKQARSYQKSADKLLQVTEQLTTVTGSLAANADAYTDLSRSLDTHIDTFNASIRELNKIQIEVAAQSHALATKIGAIEASFTSTTRSMEAATRSVAVASDSMIKQIDKMAILVQNAANTVKLVEQYMGGTSNHLIQTNDQLLRVTQALRDVTDALTGIKIIDGGVLGWLIARGHNRISSP